MAWSAEGLLVYLPPNAQGQLFHNITTLSAPGSRLATEHVPDLSAFTDNDRMQSFTQPWRQYGTDVGWSQLVYHGERSHVIDYLTARGWQPTAQTTTELYAASGFALPDDQLDRGVADMTYLSAVLSAERPEVLP
jgi:methyltransferase (TIGR00027 family)